MDGELLTKIFFGALSSLVLMLIAPWIYRKMYPKKKAQSNTSMDEKEAKILRENIKKITPDAKKTLLELKDNGVINNEEYSEKLKIIESKEEQVRREINAKKLDEKVKNLIEPFIEKLNDLLKVGVISIEEFELKKEKLYTEKKKFLIENPYSIREFKVLEGWQKRAVRDLFIIRKEGDSYWYKRGTNNILSFSKEEVDNLKAKGTIMNYFYIELPLNFDPDTIK